MKKRYTNRLRTDSVLERCPISLRFGKVDVFTRYKLKTCHIVNISWQISNCLDLSSHRMMLFVESPVFIK